MNKIIIASTLCIVFFTSSSYAKNIPSKQVVQNNQNTPARTVIPLARQLARQHNENRPISTQRIYPHDRLYPTQRTLALQTNIITPNDVQIAGSSTRQDMNNDYRTLPALTIQTNVNEPIITQRVYQARRTPIRQTNIMGTNRIKNAGSSTRQDMNNDYKTLPALTIQTNVNEPIITQRVYQARRTPIIPTNIMGTNRIKNAGSSTRQDMNNDYKTLPALTIQTKVNRTQEEK